MTMHLPEYERSPRRRDGVATIREDIHVHVGIAVLRAAVSDPPSYRTWLPPSISHFQGDTEGFRFDLSLPGRTEAGALRREPTENQREVVFVRDGTGSVERLTWALFPEGQRECHATIELAYHPARGILGGAIETLFHRAQRTQAVRDFLWGMKQDIETSARAAEEESA